MPHMRHMLDSAESIVEFVEGLTESEFRSDRRTHRAVQLEIVIIAEAAGRLPDETRVHLGDIPWHEIRAMRNRIVHEYDKVNEAKVWRAATTDVPVLIAAVRELLAQHVGE